MSLLEFFEKGKHIEMIDRVNGLKFTVRNSIGMKYLRTISDDRSKSGYFLPVLYGIILKKMEHYDEALNNQLGNGDSNISGYNQNILDEKAKKQYEVRIKEIKKLLNNKYIPRQDKKELKKERMLLNKQLTEINYNKLHYETSLRKMYHSVRVNINNAIKEISKESPKTADLIKSNIRISVISKL